MTNILEKIYHDKIIEVRERKKHLSLENICKNIKCQNFTPNRFFNALKAKKEANQTALICELKKASPSKGIIRHNFNHLEIAKIYQDNGATCLSILTDEKYFLGSDKYLREVRENYNIPILRKDFTVSKYQIYEAKMLGADAILLIVAMLDDKKLAELEQIALDCGLSVLIEIHNQEELERALKLKSKLIGVNNRNLKTMQVDIENSIKLLPQIPTDYLVVSESGINDINTIKHLKNLGINCFLIGEYFMQQQDFANIVAQFSKI